MEDRSMDEYIVSAEDDMKAALDQLSRDLGKVRTGRATPKMLDTVQVEVASYGATMPITQLATIQAPDARLLTITPWDKTTLRDIERAIVEAGLGLNPQNDGQLIRVPVPPLTAERRRDLTKGVKSTGEDCKVRVRAVRREYNEILKDGEKDGLCNEDDLRKLLDKVQDLTDRYCALVDKACTAKEAEIAEV
jgi:ribosome recycling factor